MNVISYLRSRPIHERRILALSAYAAIAAVVVAAWVVSFRNNLARIPDVGGPVAAAPADESQPPAAHPLRTPFQTLSETWRETTEHLKTGLAAAERIGRGEEEPKTTKPAGGEARQGRQESGQGDAPGTPMGDEGITIRYLPEGEAVRPGAPQETYLTRSMPSPRVQAEGNQESGNALASAAMAEPIASIVADRLTNAEALRARDRETETPPGPGGERRGFFRALSSVLAAFVRSFGGLGR